MAYGQGNYGGQQRGNPYLWQNPETGEVEYREGDMMEVSPETAHDKSPIGQMFAGDKTNIGTYAALALGGLGAANSLGAFGGAVPGASSPGAGISNFVGMGVNAPAGVGATTTATPSLGVGGLIPGIGPQAVTPATMANAASAFGGGGGMWGGLGKWAGSKFGQQMIAGGLEGLGNWGEGRRQERMMEGQNQNALQRAIIGDQFNRDLAGAQLAPTGWSQNYAQQNMLRNIMLQKLMNGSSMMPTNPEIMALMPPAFKPTIPEDWAKMDPFGTGMTRESIMQRQGNLDSLTGGRGAGLNIGAFGGSPEQQAQIDQFRASTQQRRPGMQAPLTTAVNMPRPMPGQGAQPPMGGQSPFAAMNPNLQAGYRPQAMPNLGTGSQFGAPVMQGGMGQSSPVSFQQELLRRYQQQPGGMYQMMGGSGISF